jgi:type IV pilus assembly protein PilO
VKKHVPLWPVVSVALVIVALVAYFILIRPKRAEAGRLSEQIAKLETEVSAAKLASRPSEAGKKIKVADLFELTKAMPDRDDMPGIILGLNSVAEAAGISFESIAPQNQVNAESYRVLPISLTFEGNYYDLTDFLFRLRNLVSVQDGKLAAAGRFFTLDSVDMHPATGGLPRIEAILVVSAYVFDANSHSSTLVPAPLPTTTGATTGTTTAPVGSPPTGGLG